MGEQIPDWNDDDDGGLRNGCVPRCQQLSNPASTVRTTSDEAGA